MGDVALGMKSASGAMNACIISAVSESRYFKSLHGDLWIQTVYVCMYVCMLEWVRVHQDTGSIKVG
jgi:hypothetical protein